MVQAGRFEPPRQLKPQVPKALDAICRRAMALEPSQRYQSALSLAGGHRALAGGRAGLGLVRSVAGSGAAMGAAPPAAGGRLGRRGRRGPAGARAWRCPCSRSPGGTNWQRVGPSNGNASWRSRKPNEAEANENKANEEKDRAEQALRFLVDAFRQARSVDGWTHAQGCRSPRPRRERARSIVQRPAADESDAVERDRRDVRRTGIAPRVFRGFSASLEPSPRKTW